LKISHYKFYLVPFFLGIQLNFLAFKTQQLLAIDFKIDLPPMEGATDPSFLNLDLSDADAELLSEQDSMTEQGSVVVTATPVKLRQLRATPAKPSATPAKPSATPVKTTNSIISPKKNTFELDSGEFPTPKCLTENIQFWERIYNSVRTNQMLVHDKENLSVIFGTATFLNQNQKANFQLSIKEDLSLRLTTLASKLRSRTFSADKLTARETKLFLSFPKKFQNADYILASASRIRFQGGLKENFDAGIQRSLKYMPTISPILNSYDLPEEIIFLPHVESSYTNAATSKVGAEGLWQIMPQTMSLIMGKDKIHLRRDTTVATHAAAKLLQQNFMVTKSWPLAITAYNHGLGGIQKAMRKTKSKDLCDIIENYESASFKFASSNFYAQFLAAKNVSRKEYKKIASNTPKNSSLKKLLATLEPNVE
jgi:membrane-bound lytic murein transglycosylase D